MQSLDQLEVFGALPTAVQPKMHSVPFIRHRPVAYDGPDIQTPLTTRLEH